MTGDLLYLFYILLVLIERRDKKKLNEYLSKKNMTLLDFIPESVYSEKICSINGIKAIPRKNTDDFFAMFKGKRHVNQILQFLEFHRMKYF